MKKIILLSLFLFISLIQYGQRIVYYDALYLKELVHKNGGFKITAENRPLLDFYFGSGLPDAALTAAIQQNAFLQPFFSPPGVQGFPIPGLSVPGIASAIGNLDVTNLADGFAKFLVKRTKQELNVAFFSKFKDLIESNDYKDAVILFPQTCTLLKAIGDEIYNYEAYINALREACESDLNGLPSNLRNVIMNDDYNGVGKYFAKHPQLKAATLSVLYIANGLLNKEHPGTILAEFDAKELDAFDAVSINIKAAVQTLQLFSESLRSKGSDHYWVSTDSLHLLLEDPIALRVYLGLVYQRAGTDIKFNIDGTNKTLRDLLAILLSAGNKLEDISDYVKGFIRETSTLTQNIKDISQKEKDKISFSDYYNLYNSAINLFEYASQVNRLPGLSKLSVGPHFADYIAAARASGNVALDITRKNYSSAIINTYHLYSFAFSENGTTNDAVKKFLLKYGSFLASLSQAQNSDDVEKAIEAVALPTGSSRVKRETAFNVALNGYAGLFVGHETIQGIKDGRAFNSYGVTAPIGVSISRGHSVFFIGTGKEGWKKNCRGWSTSLFISLIDLGAVAAFRFQDDTTAQVPTIQLKNIFSPGAFISLGLPKCPLSLNFGVQMGPNLRKIDKNSAVLASADNNNKIYVRYSISVVVDIPIFNFSTISKNVK